MHAWDQHKHHTCGFETLLHQDAYMLLPRTELKDKYRYTSNSARNVINHANIDVLCWTISDSLGFGFFFFAVALPDALRYYCKDLI
jgi:hypothetical protein